jgi:hypothetical protein
MSNHGEMVLLINQILLGISIVLAEKEKDFYRGHIWIEHDGYCSIATKPIIMKLCNEKSYVVNYLFLMNRNLRTFLTLEL